METLMALEEGAYIYITPEHLHSLKTTKEKEIIKETEYNPVASCVKQAIDEFYAREFYKEDPREVKPFIMEYKQQEYRRMNKIEQQAEFGRIMRKLNRFKTIREEQHD